MKLTENPVFITHKRLVHYGGVLAAMLIAGLVGFSFLMGLATNSTTRHAAQEQGEAIYAGIVGIEILVLILGGFARISRALAEDRKAGLWDSNRLTPMKPSQIVAGYWLAPALREFYMAVVLAAFGLVIVLGSGLPVTLWLGSQVLIGGTALFFGLLGVLGGLAMKRSQGILIVLVFIAAYPFSFFAPSRLLTNFLLPIYGIGNLFQTTGIERSSDWSQEPELFGLPVPPIVLSLGLQLVVGLFVWRALVRKTANPFQPLLLRWEAAVLFAILVLTQQALGWDLWSGKFAPLAGSSGVDFGQSILLPFAQGLALLMGVVVLAIVSPAPEQIRVETLRGGRRGFGAIFSRSAVSLALILFIIAAAGLFLQFMFAPGQYFRAFLVASLSLLAIFLTVALLLEFCRLRYRRRALGYFALGAFVLAVVPIILAAIFSSGDVAAFSLLAPGFIALGGSPGIDWSLLTASLAVDFLVVIALFIGWWREWKRLLA